MNPIRILVIDDDDAMRRLAVTVLAFEGYDVSAAQNAESARQEMARRLPDIVLMDRDLAGVNGLDLTRQIKADPRNREIAVLAFTASDSREDDAQAIAAGTDGFVSKPIDTPVLLRTIAWHAAARELRLGVRRTTPVRRDTGGFERPLGAATRSPSAPVRLTDR